MIHPLRSILIATTMCLVSPLWSGCHREGADTSVDSETAPYSGPDRVRTEIDAYRYRVRGYYNASNFKTLENTMAEVRAGEPLFRDGAWKLYHFYNALECREDEPESMWQLHARIHNNWDTAYPQSITARIAHADFLAEYAWHARGSDSANTVTAEGWRLFRERLAAAQEILKSAKAMQPPCPMWWLVEMRVALGQGWNQADFAKVLSEARQIAPQFSYYDSAVAKYLLPQWYGKPGDWEKAAAADMQRAGGLGVEGYARVVSHQRGYYDNVFRETQASWSNTRAGFEVMRKEYPESLEIVTVYCELACLAGDRALAQSLFQQLNGYVDIRSWTRTDYDRFHKWAFDGQAR